MIEQQNPLKILWQNLYDKTFNILTIFYVTLVSEIIQYLSFLLSSLLAQCLKGYLLTTIYQDAFIALRNILCLYIPHLVVVI